MTEFKVFYSWQSDLPNATNRGFIGDALEKACKSVANNPEVDESPRVDQDTQGLAGSPSIPQAIMEKIDACQAFVADVSLCYKSEDGTLSPNPNVVYELGYAVARLGWDRIVLVVNEEFGEVEKLPFDMEKRRAIPYVAREGEEDRSEVRKALVGRLAANVEAIAKRQPIVTRLTPADTAIEAIENQLPARRARIRDFWKWMIDELQKIEPDLRSSEPSGVQLNTHIQSLKDSVGNSGPVIQAWSRVCEAIAFADDSESAEALSRGFVKVLEEYDHKPGFSGAFNETWFDFWRFIGHELFTTWMACLLREERWSLVDETLSRTFFWEQHRTKTNRGNVSFDEFSDFVRLFGVESSRAKRLSYHADLLAQRYGPQGIGSSITFEEFIDADFFLFLAAEFRVDAASNGWMHWRPWSVLYMKHQPRFLTEASSHRIASGVKKALGESDTEAVRVLIRDRGPKLGKLWQDMFWHSPLTTEVIDAFDTKG